MNNPFFTYPGGTLRGEYNDFETYRVEAHRLLNHLKSSILKPNTLLYICIGSAMEENKCDDYYKYNQWRQLFPHYIETYLSPVEIIIISPNKLKNPGFIKITDEYLKWESSDTSTYTSSTRDIKVNIFNCMMPSENKKRTVSIAKKCTDLPLQTDTDVQFINEFYSVLKEYINKANKTICNSFAVFRNMPEYNDFRMFREIKDVIGNGILAEWKYDEMCTNTYYKHYWKYKQLSYIGNTI